MCECCEDYDCDYYDFNFLPKKDNKMSDPLKKYWQSEGCSTKFETKKLAEDEAKKRAAKQQTQYNVLEFVSCAQPEIPNVPVIQIV